MVSKRDLEQRVVNMSSRLRDLEYSVSVNNRSRGYERSNVVSQDSYHRDKIALAMRLTVIEDAISMIAEALDANGIKKSCTTCGQKLPKEKSK